MKTCEVSLCFLAIISLGPIVLTSQWLLCIHCFRSLVSFTGFYTEDEVVIVYIDQFLERRNVNDFGIRVF